MNKMKLLVYALLIAALVLPSSAAQAGIGGTVLVKISNSTQYNVILKLTGTINYLFTLPPGKSTIEVLPGKYKYMYQACQYEYHGWVQWNSDGGRFGMRKCSYAKIPVTNNTGSRVILTFKGLYSNTFLIEPGKTKISLIKGVYRYSAFYCGKTEKKTLNLTKGKIKLEFDCSAP